MQQIVIEEQATLLAGPHTCDAPLPEQQYGAPDVQTFCETVFGQLPFFPGGVFALRLLSSPIRLLGPSSEERSDEMSEDGSARGIASTLDVNSRERVEMPDRILDQKFFWMTGGDGEIFKYLELFFYDETLGNWGFKQLSQLSGSI